MRISEYLTTACRVSRQSVADLLIVGLLFSPVVAANTAVVQVPVNLDYPLLEQLLVEQLFTLPGNSTEILNDSSGCNRITLTEPQVGSAGADLEISARVDARLGISLMDNCTEILRWRGNVGILGQPVIQDGATSVRMEPTETWLIASDGSKLTSGELWSVADAQLKQYFGSFVLDFKPYINDLGGFLPDVLPNHTRGQLQSIIDSLKLDTIAVKTDVLEVSVAMTVETQSKPLTAEAELSPQELQQLEARWQMMDALLVYAVKHYAAATELQELRSALLDTLIDSRYRLRDALATTTADQEDLVRNWFLQSWQRLSPVIRRIATDQEGQTHLLWFGVLTATDALRALDQLGPSLGLDISTDGLRRLARMINDEAGAEQLLYDNGVDPELQQLLREQLQSQPSAWRFEFSLFPEAHAASSADRLNRWAPARDEMPDYLPEVGRLLESSVEEMKKQHQLSASQWQLFRKLVLATAWQESCWRQYVVENDKLVPLRSGTGDVGLMQINERVWRGFYDQQKLRWDINYNSKTGAEVLMNYMVKYAIRKGEHKQPGGFRNLARASYSAYNGGPSQVARYRRSDVPKAYMKVDAAFWDKYQQVDSGNEMGVAGCHGSDLSGPIGSLPRGTSTANAVSDKQPPGPGAGSGQWVEAQNPNNFTLQLAAFSARELAQSFIEKEGIAGSATIYRQRREGTELHLVLYGSYANREDAESAKRKFRHLKPWLRRFADLRVNLAMERFSAHG